MISLCLIVGNVEEYIERCLKSFLPIADEVCIVRAIGNQKCDQTTRIASDVLYAAGFRREDDFDYLSGKIQKRYVIEDYYNRGLLNRVNPFLKNGYEAWAKPDIDTKLWPHVDNFAAARQMSFDLATGDYCFWCDTDDLLDSGADVVRELADRGGYPVFMFPYRILYNNLMVSRERMIQRTAGRWRYPVHECFHFKIEPVQGVEDDRVVITHLPHTSKSGSNERNLRILRAIPESEMTPGLWYHLQGELSAIGDTEGATAATQRALAGNDLGKPERYELFKNLARITHDPNIKSALLHQAYQTDPCRREALALLASNALDFGDNLRGLAYARQMMATHAPAKRDWTQRDAIYGWAGNDFYAQALRANGFKTEAEAVRRETMKEAGGPRIALLHATRGRPQQAALARKLWLSLAERPDQVEHIFIFDEDDATSHCLRRFHHREIAPGGGCVAAWNAGAFNNNSDVMIQMSDDWTPPPRWDELVLERLYENPKSPVQNPQSKISDLSALPPRVLAVSDGARTDQLLCLAIITRAYLMQDCFLFHPWFKSMYSDNWFTHLAYARGQVIEARDLVFTHNHPVFGSGTGVPPVSSELGNHRTGKMPVPLPAWDATYAQQNAPERYAEGKAIFEELLAGNDWSSAPGFFDYWHFYGQVARQLQDGDTVVEVGVWLGRSIIFLAQELKRLGKPGVKLFAVDHFKGESNQAEHEATVREAGGNLRASFEANLKRCGVADMITIIDGDSAEGALHFADGSLAFCFIDAAHDYESVKRDITAWQPKVKSRVHPDSSGSTVERSEPTTQDSGLRTQDFPRPGLLAGHDAQWPEVKRAVAELCPAARFMGSVWAGL